VRTEPGTFGAHVVTEAISVAAVCFVEFREGAALNLRPITPGEVVLGLLGHCLGVRGRPAQTMTTLRAVAGGATGLAGVRGEADSAAKALVARARNGW
jgi:hypothetical protein